MDKNKEIRWNFRSYFEIIKYSATLAWKQSFDKSGKVADKNDPLDGGQKIAAVLFSFILADGAYSYSPEESQKAIANGATDVYNPSKIGYAGRFISKISPGINKDYKEEALKIAKNQDKVLKGITNPLFIRIYTQIDSKKFQSLVHKCIKGDRRLKDELKSKDSDINILLAISNSKKLLFQALLDVIGNRDNKEYDGLPFDFAEEYDIGNKSAAIQEEKPLIKPENTFEEIELLTKPPRLLVEHYKKRDKAEYDRLQQALNSSNGKVFIQGLSGLGKSEFAKEFWYKSKENKTFKYFAWIEFTDDLESSFRSQFDPLGLKKSRPKVSRDELLKIVQNMGNELFIVIDNFYSGKDFLKDDFLSDLCALNCTILITTTEKLDYLGLKQHELSVLSLENCISLFKDYYSIESDDKKISSIAEMTGYHTILIELISKSCNEEEISLDEIIVFLSENNLKYSDIGISSFHPRLATDKSVSEQLTKLFSIMSNRLSKDELDLLIKFSIFKTIPFLIENVKELFELKSRDSLRRLVKLGWIKVENYLDDSNYPRNLYSIHVAPSLTVLNNNDISIYFDTLSSKIFRLLFLTSKDTDALLLMQNIAIPYLVGAFIETFSNIESSFEFIIIYKEYIYRLNKAVIPIETSIDLCEIYAECAKDMLSKMKQSDFKKFSQKTIYNQDIFMNTPYTCDNFKQRLRFEIDMLLASSISKEKSQSSLNRQEDILMNLLTNINLNDSFETQYNLLGVYGNLLVLYCKYQQKKKILPLIKAILSEIKLQPKRKKLNELSTLYFIYAIFICLLDISNGFRILEMYDNSSKYLNRAKRILFILKKSKDKLFDFNINYEEQVIAFTYAQGRLIYCQEFGMDSYKKEFLNECKKLIRSNDQNIKDRLEECMFEYDPFFNDHPNDNIFE